jgi:hypothetical protein
MRYPTDGQKREFVRGYVIQELARQGNNEPTHSEGVAMIKGMAVAVKLSFEGGVLPDGILIDGDDELTVWHWLRHLDSSARKRLYPRPRRQ